MVFAAAILLDQCCQAYGKSPEYYIQIAANRLIHRTIESSAAESGSLKQIAAWVHGSREEKSGEAKYRAYTNLFPNGDIVRNRELPARQLNPAQTAGTQILPLQTC